ncbi:MAG: hypothetical protein OXT67_13045 [Zetaproteobacteria bacterium]|nr:hypothetical protein [Zetaproteobacteria bacterium]
MLKVICFVFACVGALVQPVAVGTALPQIWLSALPEDVQACVWLRAMQDSPEEMEQLAQVSVEAQRVFVTHRERIHPYKYHLRPNQLLLIEEATQTAVEEVEPSYWPSFLAVERDWGERTLEQPCAGLQDSRDWGRHGISFLLAWASVWSTTWEVAWQVCWDAIYDMAAKSGFSGAQRANAWIAAQSLSNNTAWDALEDLCLDHLERGTELLLEKAIWSPLGDATKAALQQNARTLVERALMTLDSRDPEVIGRVAYRVAELVVWMDVFDPSRKILTHAYEQLSTALESRANLDPQGWFDATVCLEDQIAYYFGREGRLGQTEDEPVSDAQYQLRYPYVVFGIEQLRHINARLRAVCAGELGAAVDAAR